MTARVWSPVPPPHPLERPQQDHFCQIHQKESSLVDAVIRYLLAGIGAGENLVLVTRANRRKLILQWLAAKGVDVAQLVEQRRIFLYAGSELLDAVIKDGAVDRDAFLELAPRLVDEASWSGRKNLRVYGDAVSDLWQVGQHAAAVELEACWNALHARDGVAFSLFCGYQIDALDPRSYSEHLAFLGREHAFVIPAPEDHALRCVLDEAVRHVLGVPLADASARADVSSADWRARLPLAFRIGLWLHEQHPNAAPYIMKKARALYLSSPVEPLGERHARAAR